MLRILLVAALLSATLFAAFFVYEYGSNKLPVEVTQAKQLEWGDLIPAVEPLADALSDTPINVRYDLGFIGKVVADAEAEVISTASPEYRNAMQLLDRHRAEGIDVDRLLAAVSGRDQEIAERGESLNDSLDGEMVRLPGYALPLEMGEGGVTEFLLVPFVGACIHVPPPPPNQIVLAKLDSAYEVEGLYDPVQITGLLKAQATNTELYLVDGQADIPMGYSMQVMHIEAMD